MGHIKAAKGQLHTDHPEIDSTIDGLEASYAALANPSSHVTPII